MTHPDSNHSHSRRDKRAEILGQKIGHDDVLPLRHLRNVARRRAVARARHLGTKRFVELKATTTARARVALLRAEERCRSAEKRENSSRIVGLQRLSNEDTREGVRIPAPHVPEHVEVDASARRDKSVL